MKFLNYTLRINFSVKNIGEYTTFFRTNKTKAGKKSLPPAVCLMLTAAVAKNRLFVR
jgi:hypothetical protein